MRHAILGGLVGLSVLMFTTPAAAERNWEFSIGGFGGRAFHADTTFRYNWATTPSFGLEPVNAKGTGLRFENSDSFGIKLSAWYLPRRYRWEPQIGLELDGTRFTADVPPQTIPAEGVGVASGVVLDHVIINTRREFGVDSLAVNLLFRYPI